MPWTLNRNNVVPTVNLTNSEQNNLNTFMNGVGSGNPPNQVAREWDSDYKRLQGNQFQIRLSKGNRATFTVDDTNEVVTMLQVGGHT